MTARFKLLAAIACLVALALTIAACGSDSKNKESSGSGTPAATSDAASGSERAQAKTALATWLTLTGKLNAAGQKYGTDEPQHAQEKNLLAIRRDGYDLRNAIYGFDLAVRKVKFPGSLEPRVNSLLETTRSMVAALDGLSQASRAEDVNSYIRKANAIDLKDAVNTLNEELHRLAGRPLATADQAGAGGSSEATKVAAGLLTAKAHSGAKTTDQAACAGKSLVKDLKQPDLDRIAAGDVPQTGPVANAIGAALVVCQFEAGKSP